MIYWIEETKQCPDRFGSYYLYPRYEFPADSVNRPEDPSDRVGFCDDLILQ